MTELMYDHPVRIELGSVPVLSYAMARALLVGVAAEGPIHLDRLARSVAAAFDLTRVSSARSAAILAELPRGVVRGRNERFAWPNELDPETWMGFRRAPQSEPRIVDHVALREIANAMFALCSASAGMYEEELLRDTLGIFGGKRLTPGISSRLRTALESAVEGERLVLGTDGLYVAR